MSDALVLSQSRWVNGEFDELARQVFESDSRTGRQRLETYNKLRNLPRDQRGQAYEDALFMKTAEKLCEDHMDFGDIIGLSLRDLREFWRIVNRRTLSTFRSKEETNSRHNRMDRYRSEPNDLSSPPSTPPLDMPSPPSPSSFSSLER